MLKARALETFMSTSEVLRQQHARTAERKQTDVRVGGALLPVEVAESVSFQAFQQIAAHLHARLGRTRDVLEKSMHELQAFKADITAERASLAQMSIADVVAKHPQWGADAFKAQEEHRWFERAMEGEEDEEPAADAAAAAKH